MTTQGRARTNACDKKKILEEFSHNECGGHLFFFFSCPVPISPSSRNDRTLIYL